MCTTKVLAPFACFALVASGCVEHLGEDESSVGRLLRDCDVPTPSGVASLGPPVALEYPTRSLWIWEALELEDGSLASNAYAFVENVDTLCDEGPDLRRAGGGPLQSVLELSSEEVAYDATRDDGRHRWLRPLGGLVHDDVGYLFYEHLDGTGFFDFEVLGTGLCVLEPEATRCRRIEVGGSSLLWAPGERPLDQGGLVVGDRGFMYGCKSAADFLRFCLLSSSPLEDLTNPAAYRFFNVNRGWVESQQEASVLSDELGPITMSHYPRGFLATTLDIFDSGVYVLRAPTAAEELYQRVHAFDIAPTDAVFPSGGREHASLRQGSHEIVVSYGVERAGASRLRLAHFRFHGSQTGERYQPNVNGDGP